jgi:hypothetical protein
VSALAATTDEQAQAREAWRLADHKLDLTFGRSHARRGSRSRVAVTGPLRQLGDRIRNLKANVDADKKRVDQLCETQATR